MYTQLSGNRNLFFQIIAAGKDRLVIYQKFGKAQLTRLMHRTVYALYSHHTRIGAQEYLALGIADGTIEIELRTDQTVFTGETAECLGLRIEDRESVIGSYPQHTLVVLYNTTSSISLTTLLSTPLIRAILRSAVYQIKYMDSIPDHAVCSESVKLAVKKGFSGLRGYVNGVLRSVVKEIDEVEYPSDPIKRLSVRYSCPEWIIRLWKETYDLSLIETMLKDFQTEKPTTIRRCRSRITMEQLKKRLEEEHVLVENHPYLKDALLISKYDYLESLETFREGLFVVQDISSMLVGELAHVQAGAQVIDLCAAPGGKALDVAERILMEGQAGCSGHVEARDLTEYKVSLIEENIERMGLCNVTAVCQDASVYDEKSAGKADIVIADLPCSGLGVLGKKTDLKYKASPEGIVSLVKLQRKILSCAASYVKPGGELLYSTCTVNPKENIENVHWFLKEFPEFYADDIREDLCLELRESVTENGCIQLLPGVHKSDGFFIARLRKKEV